MSGAGVEELFLDQLDGFGLGCGATKGGKGEFQAGCRGEDEDTPKRSQL